MSHAKIEKDINNVLSNAASQCSHHLAKAIHELEVVFPSVKFASGSLKPGSGTSPQSYYSNCKTLPGVELGKELDKDGAVVLVVLGVDGKVRIFDLAMAQCDPIVPCIQAYPLEHSGRTDYMLTLKYVPKAISVLEGKRTVPVCHDTKTVSLALGQECCESCGHIFLSGDFFRGSGCPNCFKSHC